MALNLLVDQLRRKNPEINIEITHAGSLGGLIALQEDRADLGRNLISWTKRQWSITILT